MNWFRARRAGPVHSTTAAIETPI